MTKKHEFDMTGSAVELLQAIPASRFRSARKFFLLGCAFCSYIRKLGRNSVTTLDWIEIQVDLPIAERFHLDAYCERTGKSNLVGTFGPDMPPIWEFLATYMAWRPESSDFGSLRKSIAGLARMMIHCVEQSEFPDDRNSEQFEFPNVPPVLLGEQEQQRLQVLDIFGHLFRPVTIHPHWQTSSVVDLADAIYNERAFDRMPYLADALMDAGCDNDDMIQHCRGPGPHVKGCWVVDLLLGKE